MSRRWFLAGWIGFMVAMGCGGTRPNAPLDDGGLPDAGGTRLSITTSVLPDGWAGADYSASLSAAGGQGPLSWSLGTVPAGFDWLHIAPGDGSLSGVAGVSGQGQIPIQVSDGQEVASATLSLRINSCREGATVDCLAPGATACFSGTRTCQGGVFQPCQSSGIPTTDVNQCGPSCGSCGNTGDSCVSGACVCGNTGADCGTAVGSSCCASKCVDTLTNLGNCGGCGNICATPAHAAPTCSGGSCGYACNSGYLDCNKSASDGCEIDDQTDPAHCGSCQNGCQPPAHSSSTCVSGTCGYACSSGFLDCNKSAADGCEINDQTDPAHCGSCSNVCPTPANSVPTCSSGTCGYACKVGFGNCNQLDSDGCETDLNTNSNHCGTCGNACDTANGEHCLGGQCCITDCTNGCHTSCL